MKFSADKTSRLLAAAGDDHAWRLGCSNLWARPTPSWCGPRKHTLALCWYGLTAGHSWRQVNN